MTRCLVLDKRVFQHLAVFPIHPGSFSKPWGWNRNHNEWLGTITAQLPGPTSPLNPNCSLDLPSVRQPRRRQRLTGKAVPIEACNKLEPWESTNTSTENQPAGPAKKGCSWMSWDSTLGISLYKCLERPPPNVSLPSHSYVSYIPEHSTAFFPKVMQVWFKWFSFSI